jgi:hypothetical protein
VVRQWAREKKASKAAVVVQATPQPEPEKVIPDATPIPVPIARATPMPAPATPEPVKPATAEPVSFAQELVLDAVEGKKAEHVRRRDELLRATLEGARWKDYADLLRRSLAVQLRRISPTPQPQEYDQLLANPLVHLALLQQAFIRALSDDARTAISATRYDPEFYPWLLTTPEALEDWLVAARPEDNLKTALQNWESLQSGDKSARDKYRQLAIACALVFDKEVRPEWNGERLELTALTRFAYYKQHDLAGDLATHLAQMNARDLTWVVAAPVPDSELDWARKKVRLKQGGLGARIRHGSLRHGESRLRKTKEAVREVHFQRDPGERWHLRGPHLLRHQYGSGTRYPRRGNQRRRPDGRPRLVRWKADDYTWKEDGRLGGYGAGKARDRTDGEEPQRTGVRTPE